MQLVGLYTAQSASITVPSIESSSVYIVNSAGVGGVPYGSELIRRMDLTTFPVVITYINPATGAAVSAGSSDVSSSISTKSLGKVEITSLTISTKLYSVLSDIPTGTKMAVIQVLLGEINHTTLGSDIAPIVTASLTSGYKSSAGSSFLLESFDDIKAFRAISATGAKIYCEFRG